MLQLCLNRLIRLIIESDKLKITLNSVSYPFLTILPTPNCYRMVYLSRVRLHAAPTCVINSYPIDVIWSSLTFARKVVVLNGRHEVMLNEPHINPVWHMILIQSTFLYIRESIYDHMWGMLQSVNMAKYQNSQLPWSTYPVCPYVH